MAHEHGPEEQHEAGPKHELSHWAKRAYAMRDILIEKGVVTEEDIRQQAEFTESKTPANGARLVARAWTDPDFKGPAHGRSQEGVRRDGHRRKHFERVRDPGRNTDRVRHMVVCTLCSCYPRPDPRPAAGLVQELSTIASGR